MFTGGVGVVAPAQTLPSWRNGLAVNAWTQIVGSAMTNTPPTVDPDSATVGPSAKLDSWSGLQIDTRTSTVWGLATGGHDDYHGNEVMRLELGDDSPVWVEMLASDSQADIGVNNNAGYYPTGRPASCHTYYSQHFCRARDRAMRFGAQAASEIGNSFTNVDGYDCNATAGVSGWDASGTYASLVSVVPAAVLCKNETTEDVYHFVGNTSVRKWTQSTNTWSQVNVGFPPVDPTESASAYDTSRGRIFLLRANTICHTFDPATGKFTAQTLTGAAATTLTSALKGAGMKYIPDLDAYIVRLGASGGALYSINAGTFEATALTTTGGDLVPAPRVISGTENVYTKILDASQFDCLIYFPKYSEDGWAFRYQ